MKEYKEKKRRGLGLKPLIAAMACIAALLAVVFVWALTGSIQLEDQSGHGLGIVEAVHNMMLSGRTESNEVAASIQPGSTANQTLTAGSPQSGTVQEKTSEPIQEDMEQKEAQMEPKEEPAVYERINEATKANPESGVVDVTRLESVSAEQVCSWIGEYQFGDWAYLDGNSMTEEDREAILSRRNLEGITDPVQIRYGIVTDNAAVRAFPTWRKAASGPDERSFDYIQESMLLTGEPVAVVHQTADGIWSFVQATNYRGWIETGHIGFCTAQEQRQWVEEAFAVVTDAGITLGDHRLRMGTALPAREDGMGNLILSIPSVGEDGSLSVCEVTREQGSGLHLGWLELSTDQVLRQAKLLVGTDYGWGDSNGDMDCSSTMNAIYRCFGILLPRNTSSMMYTGTQVISLEGMDAKEKEEKIVSLESGTLLLMRGHVVMYIGETDREPLILHNFTTCLAADGVSTEEVYQCRITPLDLTTAAGSHYLDRYLYAICFPFKQD